MRNLVSPVFTSGKLKMMVPHIEKCADNLDAVFASAAETGEILEAKDVFGKFTLDAIASSGFGIESNSFKNPDSIFRKTALRMVRYVLCIQSIIAF
jgi:cytochrome P450